MAFEKEINTNPGASEKFKEDPIYERTRQALGAIFAQQTDGPARVKALDNQLGGFLEQIKKGYFPPEEITAIKKNLDNCADAADAPSFIEKAMAIISPLLSWRVKNKIGFEEVQSHFINADQGFIEVNRLIAYDIKDQTLRLHHSLGETVGDKKGLYRDGMKKIAAIVVANPQIQNIGAKSWIVAEHPGLFANAGFSIGEVSPEDRAQHFAKEKRDIKLAIISREEFLKRFLSEK